MMKNCKLIICAAVCGFLTITASMFTVINYAYAAGVEYFEEYELQNNTEANDTEPEEREVPYEESIIEFNEVFDTPIAGVNVDELPEVERKTKEEVPEEETPKNDPPKEDTPNDTDDTEDAEDTEISETEETIDETADTVKETELSDEVSPEETKDTEEKETVQPESQSKPVNVPEETEVVETEDREELSELIAETVETTSEEMIPENPEPEETIPEETEVQNDNNDDNTVSAADSEETVENTAGELRSLGVFKITYYCCERYPHICGTGNGITASGLVLEPGMIAVDTSIIPLGTTVVIDGKEYLAADTGGSIKGNVLDIAFATHQEALNLGVTYKEVFVYN